MPNPPSPLEAEYLEHAANILKTVAHPMRLRIIDVLESGEKTVTELSQHLGAPQPYTSQQLNLMKNKGILGSRREGNQVYYEIANLSVVKVIHCVRQQQEHADGDVAGCRPPVADPALRDAGGRKS